MRFKEFLLTEVLNKNAINFFAAQVNEILVGYYMLGGPSAGSWKGYVNADVAKSKLAEIAKKIPPEEYKIREDRAKAQAGAIRQWIASPPHNTVYGKGVKNVWWTVDPGSAPRILYNATKKTPSSKNPTDTLLGFGPGVFLGVSAKSGEAKSKKTITMFSPGLKDIDKDLGTNIEEEIRKAEEKAKKDYDLPETKKEMKDFLRKEENAFVQQATIDVGKSLLRLARDKVLEAMSKLSQAEVKKVITHTWLKMGEGEIIFPYYIKVTAIGEFPTIHVDILDPEKDNKIYELYNGKITFQPGGDTSLTVLLNNKYYFSIFTKYRSEKIATTLHYQVKGF